MRFAAPFALATFAMGTAGRAATTAKGTVVTGTTTSSTTAASATLPALNVNPEAHIADFHTWGSLGCRNKIISTRNVYGSDVIQPMCHGFGGDNLYGVLATKVNRGCSRKWSSQSACRWAST